MHRFFNVPVSVFITDSGISLLHDNNRSLSLHTMRHLLFKLLFPETPLPVFYPFFVNF